MPNRYTELDLLRSLAILGMIVYHVMFDLVAFYDVSADLTHGGWLFFQRTVAIIFLLLVGISFAISHHRTQQHVFRKFLKRSAVILACGLLISCVTYSVDPNTYVRFGVLHLIGVSMFLLPLVTRFKYWNLLIAAVLLTGFWMHTTGSTLLIPLGFPPADFQTVDYFPLIPWFGVILIGLWIGQEFYVRRLSWRSSLPSLLTTHDSLLTRPGRHALIIYMIHQPIILGVLWIIFR